MFVNMQMELLGDIPGIPLPYAKTILNQGLGMIYDEQFWSFQIGEAGWLTPGLLGATQNRPTSYLSPGTMTIAPFSVTMVMDATATAMLQARVGRPFLTEMQVRVPQYSLYNIIGYDDGTTPGQGNYPLATLTLDRMWMEPAQTAQTFMIYQAYFPVPLGFKKFVAAKDTTNNAPMDWWTRDQKYLSIYDPQRTVFDLPSSIVPYRTDSRTGSATFGQMLYELWPQPLSQLPYSYTFLQRGPVLTAPTDTVPYPLTEELVMWRAKEVGYLWKEAQKGDGMERGSGADWRFLAQEAHAQYKVLKKIASLLDQNLVDLYWNKFNRGLVMSGGDGYETATGMLNVGGW